MKKKIGGFNTGLIIRNTGIILLLLLLVVALFSKRIFITIKPGEAGVLYNIFTGTDMSRTYGEGLHIISPVNTMIVYNVRTHKINFDQYLLSANGLTIHVLHSVLYKPDVRLLPSLHQQIGPGYEQLIVDPSVKSMMRKEIAGLTPEEIFMIDRGVVEKNSRSTLSQILAKDQVIIEGYYITSISLPDSVNKAIESVYRQQQLNEEYNYRLAVEDKERTRKGIEAQGLREFSSVSKISPLLWKALDVTQKIGTSPNSKLIFMGSGAKGLPILLSDQMAAGQDTTAQRLPVIIP
ncbi:prohibitin family protein [Chitinophaga sancti]|uniref:prohibitin family protein n=1 Tax=Chitinophaga sancti TaxID=1004 RepID=UPI002A762F24|nr:prohibitin family protein [Chitinophaga sancti]WPQ66219.1 prohibitin family protein [Chitinophaga sancti]